MPHSLQIILRQDNQMASVQAQHDLAVVREFVTEMKLSGSSPEVYGAESVRFHAAYLQLCLTWFENAARKHSALFHESQQVQSGLGRSARGRKCDPKGECVYLNFAADLCPLALLLHPSEEAPPQPAFGNAVPPGPTEIGIRQGEIDNLSLLHGALFPGWMNTMAYSDDLGLGQEQTVPIDGIADTWSDPLLSAWLNDLAQEPFTQ